MTKLEDYPFTVRPLAVDDGGRVPVRVSRPAWLHRRRRDDRGRDPGGRAALWPCIETLRDLGRPVPEPSTPEPEGFSGRWLMRVPKGLHQRLAEQARAEGVSLNTLAATMLAEGLGYRLAKRRIGVAAK